MALRDVSRQINGTADVERESNQLRQVDDAFDAPMMIMNQIHEA